jgi:hypothetical protein
MYTGATKQALSFSGYCTVRVWCFTGLKYAALVGSVQNGWNKLLQLPGGMVNLI